MRYAYEVRDEADYFDDVPAAHITKDMLEWARHIVKTKTGHSEPNKFEDHYEEALKELIDKKRKGEKIEAPKKHAPAKVVNRMDALRRSVEGAGERRRPAASSRTRRTTNKRAGHSTSRRGRRAEFHSLTHLFRPIIALVSLNHSTDSWMTKDESNSDSKTILTKDVSCNDAGHQNRGMVRVEAETAEDARRLLEAGDGHRCHVGDCLHVELGDLIVEVGKKRPAGHGGPATFWVEGRMENPL